MPDYEQMLQDAYERFLRPGDVVFDIGGNVGRHTLPLAAKVGPRGRVFVFEPLEVCRKELIAGVEAAGNGAREAVKLHDCALGEAEGAAEYNFAVDNPGYSGLKERTYDTPTKIEKIQVQVRKLDSFADAAPSCAMIKLDVEGGELGVLRGGRKFIAKFKPLVTFEFGANSIWGYGITPRDMADYWAGMNYKVYDILGRPLDAAAFVESAARQEVWDYAAVPAGRGQWAGRLFGQAPPAGFIARLFGAR